MYIIFVIYISF